MYSYYLPILAFIDSYHLELKQGTGDNRCKIEKNGKSLNASLIPSTMTETLLDCNNYLETKGGFIPTPLHTHGSSELIVITCIHTLTNRRWCGGSISWLHSCWKWDKNPCHGSCMAHVVILMFLPVVGVRETGMWCMDGLDDSVTACITGCKVRKKKIISLPTTEGIMGDTIIPIRSETTCMEIRVKRLFFVTKKSNQQQSVLE